LFDLSYQGRMPVDKAPKRQAWTAQQKWFAVELKRKFPDKKLDDIIIAVKAKFDRDVSSSTLCAWLKPETAAKIEQLANASGQNTKRRRICDYPKLEHALFLWYRGHETRGAAVTGDVLTQKAKELALIPELEVSEGFVCSSGWLTNFKKRHGISSQVRHGEAGSAPEASVQLAQTELKAAGGVAGQGRREPGECATRGHLQHGRVRPVLRAAASRTLARGRTAGNKKDKKRMTVALTVNATGTQQLKPIIIHTAQKPRAFPKNFKVESALNVHWYFNKTAWMLSTVFQDWLRKVCLHSTS
jgi:hypothetical protein